MKKLLFCQPTMQFSGSENSLLQLVNLLKEDTDITILIGERGPFEQKISGSLRSERITHVKSTKLKRSLSSISSFFMSFWSIFLFFRKAKKNKHFDTIIVNTLMFPQAYLGAYLNGFPVMMICRENPKTYGKIPFFFYASLAMICCKRIVLLFDKQQTYFPFSKSSDTFITIPNTIAEVLKIEHKVINREYFTVLSVVGMSVRKGIFDLLNIAREVFEIHNNRIVFQIVGSKDENMINEFYLQYPHMRETVRFLGVQKNMAEFYKAADVFLHPSHTEALPRVVLEAISHQLPVVATDVGGTYTMVVPDKNGFLFAPGDASPATAALSDLFLDQRRYTTYAQYSGKLFNRNFAPARIKDNFLELIYNAG